MPEGLLAVTTMTLAVGMQRTALTSRLFTNGWLWGAILICVLLQLAAVYVPFLREVVPLTADDCGLVALGSLAPVAVVELVKLVPRWRRRAR